MAMHELSMAQSLLDIALRHGDQAHARSIVALHVRVGAASGIDPESLAFSFGIASRGTPAEGANLHVEIIPLRARCRSCGAERELAGSPRRAEEWYIRMQVLGACVCGDQSYELAGGAGCFLESIDVE